MDVVTLDAKGRVTIPRRIREMLRGVKRFKVSYRDGRIVLEPLGSAADRFYGAFRPARRVPRDIDRVIGEAVEEAWRRERTST